jgi:hypothetical protein
MNVLTFGLGALIALACLATACSEDNTNETPAPRRNIAGGSGSSKGSGGESGTSDPGGESSSPAEGAPTGPSNGSDECAVPFGTYIASYTTRPGGIDVQLGACPDIGDQEIVFKGWEEREAPNCTLVEDTPNCNYTLDCKAQQGGYTIEHHIETSTKGGVVSGVQSAKNTKDADGKVVYDCTHDFTWTMK